MALTRKFLSAMGIEGDKIDEIINAHAETVDGLKAERDEAKRQIDTYKTDAEKLPGVQKELDELKAAQGSNIFETKFEEMKTERDKVQSEFDQYKKDIEAAETKRAKENAFRGLLKKVNISDARIEKILKVSDIDSIELDKDGKLKDEEGLNKTIQEDWGDFIPETHQEGAKTATPINNSTQTPKGESRAAKIAAQYHSNLYGVTKEEK